MRFPQSSTGAGNPAASDRGTTGYVFTGNLPAKDFEDVAAGKRPRSEYHVYCGKYPTQILTFDRIAEGNWLARALARSGRPVPGIAVAALSRRPQFGSILATGENIGFPAAIYARVARSDVPVNVIVHGSYFGSRYMGAVAGALRLCRNVRYLTLCESLRNQMLDRFGFDPELVVNAGYGVDTEFFQPAVAPPSERPIIASAGAASRDYRTLIRATHDLPADVRIAADSAWFPSAVDISADQLPTNCEARSYGNYLGLRALYASAAFVVVPLYPAHHACGLAVIAEAMAMGKAVITTRIAGRSDFLVDGENGFYVEPGDVAGLRARIEQLLQDPARAREMGRAARDRMVAEFTLETYVQRLAQAMI